MVGGGWDKKGAAVQGSIGAGSLLRHVVAARILLLHKRQVVRVGNKQRLAVFGSPAPLGRWAVGSRTVAARMARWNMFLEGRTSLSPLGRCAKPLAPKRVNGTMCLEGRVLEFRVCNEMGGNPN